MQCEPCTERYVTYILEECGQLNELFPELLFYILEDECHVTGCYIIKNYSIQLYSFRV